ncbi:MAG: hypothetical protein ACO1OB_26805 [Archangium sp.]
MWRKLQKHIPDVDKDDLLDLVGLESRRSTGDKIVPALAIFGAGLLVGAGLGLLFAQKPGKKLRGELRDRISKGAEEVKATVESAVRSAT